MSSKHDLIIRGALADVGLSSIFDEDVHQIPLGDEIFPLMDALLDRECPQEVYGSLLFALAGQGNSVVSLIKGEIFQGRRPVTYIQGSGMSSPVELREPERPISVATDWYCSVNRRGELYTYIHHKGRRGDFSKILVPIVASTPELFISFPNMIWLMPGIYLSLGPAYLGNPR